MIQISSDKFGGSEFYYIVSGTNNLQHKSLEELKLNFTTIREQTKLLQGK